MKVFQTGLRIGVHFGRARPSRLQSLEKNFAAAVDQSLLLSDERVLRWFLLVKGVLSALVALLIVKEHEFKLGVTDHSRVFTFPQLLINLMFDLLDQLG